MTQPIPRSEALFARAGERIPGGVNSPVRAFGAVGGTPRFIESADGAWIRDADGHAYIDYIGSWGPMILGHQHPAVLEALRAQLERGISYGAPTALEAEMAEDSWLVEAAEVEDVFTGSPDLLWSRVLRRKGPEYDRLSRMPFDPSMN